MRPNTFIIPEAPFRPLAEVNGYPLHKYSAYVWERAERRLFLVGPNYHDCIRAYPDLVAQLEGPPALVLGGHLLSPEVHRPVGHSDWCQLATIHEFCLPPSTREESCLQVELDGGAYSLPPSDLHRTYDILEATLFKWDADHLPAFVRYYAELHGVDGFLLYYNGPLSQIAGLIETLRQDTRGPDVYLYEWNLPYWQTFCGKDDVEATWKHSAQSVQLAHASLLANFHGRNLVSMDLDEYLDPQPSLRGLTGADLVYFRQVQTSCGGRFCDRRERPTVDSLLEVARSGTKAPQNPATGKFMQQTLGRRRFFRRVHWPMEPFTADRFGSYSHLRCMSPRFDAYGMRSRRKCVAGPGEQPRPPAGASSPAASAPRNPIRLSPWLKPDSTSSAGRQPLRRPFAGVWIRSVGHLFLIEPSVEPGGRGGGGSPPEVVVGAERLPAQVHAWPDSTVFEYHLASPPGPQELVAEVDGVTCRVAASDLPHGYGLAVVASLAQPPATADFFLRYYAQVHAADLFLLYVEDPAASVTVPEAGRSAQAQVVLCGGPELAAGRSDRGALPWPGGVLRVHAAILGHYYARHSLFLGPGEYLAPSCDLKALDRRDSHRLCGLPASCGGTLCGGGEGLTPEIFRGSLRPDWRPREPNPEERFLLRSGGRRLFAPSNAPPADPVEPAGYFFRLRCGRSPTGPADCGCAEAAARRHARGPGVECGPQTTARRLLDTGIFDPVQYAAQVGRRFDDPLVAAAHYATEGVREGLDPHPLFRTNYYLAANPEIVRSRVNPLLHYADHGWREGRSPCEAFDTAYYLANAPDVAAAGVNPLVHYLSFGAAEGRKPAPAFDSSYYLRRNPDVAASGVNPLVHYVRHGREEGRSPSPEAEAEATAGPRESLASMQESWPPVYAVPAAPSGAPSDGAASLESLPRSWLAGTLHSSYAEELASIPFPAGEIARMDQRRWILANAAPSGVGAELGVFRGHLSEVLATTLRPRRLYLVDHWTLAGERFNWGADPYTDGDRLTTRQALDDTRRRMRAHADIDVRIVQARTRDFLEWLRREGLRLDWVYLDSSHRYEETLAELEALARVLAPTGVILGDDWVPRRESRFHGIFLAVHAVLREGLYELVAAGPASQFCLRLRP